MKDLISALEDLSLQIRNMKEHLRGEEWASKEVSSAAVDVCVYGGMTYQAVERLKGLLVPLEEAKVEATVAVEFETAADAKLYETMREAAAIASEEEEGGEDLGEQVPEPEAGEAGPEVPVQEPKPRAPKGSKRVRKRKG